MIHRLAVSIGGFLLVLLLASCVSHLRENAKNSKRSVRNLEVYLDVVHPIFEQNCITCHNTDDRKGELDLESYEGLLSGCLLYTSPSPRD